MPIDYNSLIEINKHIFNTQSREAAVQHAVANGLYGGYQGNYDEYTPEYALSLQMQAENALTAIPNTDVPVQEQIVSTTPWEELGLSQSHYDEWRIFETEFYETYYPSVELTGLVVQPCVCELF